MLHSPLRPILISFALSACAATSAADGPSDGSVPQPDAGSIPKDASATDGSWGEAAADAALRPPTAPCTVDTTLGWSVYTTTVSVASDGTALYLDSYSEKKTWRFKIAPGSACALTLDSSFGNAGILPSETPPGAAHVYATPSALYGSAARVGGERIRRVWPPSEQDCEVDLYDAFAITDDGMTGITSWSGANTGSSFHSLTFGAGGCTVANTGVAVPGNSRPVGMGLGPNGLVYTTDGRTIGVFDTKTSMVVHSFQNEPDSFKQSNVTAVRGCGADICAFEAASSATKPARLMRFTTAGTRKSELKLQDVAPSVDWSPKTHVEVAFAAAGTAYAIYGNATGFDVARFQVP